MEPVNPPTKLPSTEQKHGTEIRNSSSESRGLMAVGNPSGYIIDGEEGSGQTGAGIGSSFKKYSGFTFLQMRELEIQTMIYKYMEAGVPVPYHLIFPIWSSLSGLKITKEFKSYRNNMDVEPQRCRRTDGKKWRCSKNVVHNHKYCQRHLHRGRALRTSRNFLEVSSSTTT